MDHLSFSTFFHDTFEDSFTYDRVLIHALTKEKEDISPVNMNKSKLKKKKLQFHSKNLQLFMYTKWNQ